jgi:hypothetical protein
MGFQKPARPGCGVTGVVGHDHFRCRTTPSHTWNGRTALVGIVTVVVTGPVATQLGKTLGVGHAGMIAWEIAKWPVLLLVFVVALVPGMKSRRSSSTPCARTTSGTRAACTRNNGFVPIKDSTPRCGSYLSGG